MFSLDQLPEGMFETEMVQYAILGLGAISVFVILYLILDPLLSDKEESEKRLDKISGKKKNKSKSLEGISEQNRKKQVQDALKEIEKKNKSKKRVTMRVRLQQAGLETLDMKVFYFCSLLSALGLSVATFLFGAELYLVGLAFFVGFFGLPHWVLSRKIKRRQKQFIAEFGNSLDIIVRGVKAGLPFNDCLQIITTESQEPVKSEFQNILEHQRVGVPMEQALFKMYERVPIQEVNFFCIVVSIQMQVGGNISEALGNLSQVLRDRRKLRDKIKALSSEAKASAGIIAALPILVMLGVYATTPAYISLLWNEPRGHLILGASAALMLTGVLIMRQMINFKI